MNNDDELINIEVIIRRSNYVFDRLWENGEESRTIMWDQLCDYVAVDVYDIVKLACGYVLKFISSPEASKLSQFVSNYAKCIVSNIKNEEFDIYESVSALLSIVESRISDIGKDAKDSLLALENIIYKTDDYSLLVTKLLDDLLKIDKKSTVNVINTWISEIFNSLPDNCIKWLGSNFTMLLDATQKSSLISKLNYMYQNVSLTEAEGSKFKCFMDALPEAAIKTNEITNFIDNLFSVINQQFSNWQYIKAVFPPIPRLLCYLTPEKAAIIPYSLFTNAKNYRDIYGFLHQQMVGYWPIDPNAIANYDPQVIFNDAITFIQQDIDGTYVDELIKSSYDMIKRKILNDTYIPTLVEVACITWRKYRTISSEIINNFDILPNNQYIANLMNPINYNNEVDKQFLRDTWTHLARLLCFSRNTPYNKCNI